MRGISALSIRGRRRPKNHRPKLYVWIKLLIGREARANRTGTRSVRTPRASHSDPAFGDCGIARQIPHGCGCSTPSRPRRSFPLARRFEESRDGLTPFKGAEVPPPHTHTQRQCGKNEASSRQIRIAGNDEHLPPPPVTAYRLTGVR